MSSSDREDSNQEEAQLAESKARLDVYRAARKAAASTEEQASQHARSKFAIILNELDLRSRKSNQWLIALSVVYVVVTLAIISGLFYKYSKVEKLVNRLDSHLDQTGVAIAEQESTHRKQSQEISGDVVATGVVLDGISKESEALGVQLDEGKKKADDLLRESIELKTKIAKIDVLLEGLAKRAEPFYAHYAIDPEKPQRFGREEEFVVTFESPQSKALLIHPEDTELNGKFFIPVGGTYMVTGWFSTEDQSEAPRGRHLVESEIRVDGVPYWSGFSYGNGSFTSGIPLKRGQIISIHATVRSSETAEEAVDAEEPDPPSGSIERGEIRIARLYYSPE